MKKQWTKLIQEIQNDMFEESRIRHDKFKKIYTYKNECIDFSHKRLHFSRTRKQITFNKIFF